MSKTLAAGSGSPDSSVHSTRERDVLIALNASERIPRDQAMRLAGTLESWLDKGLTSLRAKAVDLQVAPTALRSAVALTADAREIAQAEKDSAAKIGATILTRRDSGYPEALFDLELPPAVLYCRGRLPIGAAVAVVGSRAADPYGLQIAERFSTKLAAHGVTIVSGFARGVDQAAHRGAISAGGSTIAVLGCGLDIDYPHGQSLLATEIAKSGAILSEFRMGTDPKAWHFPVRNRIIAALSAGTLVVRAALRSGSLITARHSLELGRDVYAIPGNIFDRCSAGVNNLIRDGAHPIQDPLEILEILPLAVQDLLTAPTETTAPTPTRATKQNKAPKLPSDPTLAALFEILPATTPMAQDELVARSDLSVDTVISGLFELELQGFVQRYPGPAYCRTS